MTELETATALANRVLYRINADPDDDLAILARQFLRALEREQMAKKVTVGVSVILENSRRSREIAKDLLASLVATISILNRSLHEKKPPNKVVASDAMFDQMMIDYCNSVDRARNYLLETADV